MSLSERKWSLINYIHFAKSMPHDLFISLASRKFFRLATRFYCKYLRLQPSADCKELRELHLGITATLCRTIWTCFIFNSISIFSRIARKYTYALGVHYRRVQSHPTRMAHKKEENERQPTDRSKSSNFYSNEHTNQVNEWMCVCRIMTCSIHILLVHFQVYIKLWKSFLLKNRQLVLKLKLNLSLAIFNTYV